MNNFMPYSYQNFGYQTPTRQMAMQPQFQPAMPIQQQPTMQMPTQPTIQQPMQQPIQQPLQANMPTDTPIQSVVFATLKEAEAYILMPNTKGLFIDKTSGMIYEKVCGADGQSFITHYKKVDLNENKSIAEENNDNMPEFATKTDLKNFITVEEYKNLKEELKGLQGQIKGLKIATEKPNKTKTENKTETKTNKESE